MVTVFIAEQMFGLTLRSMLSAFVPPLLASVVLAGVLLLVGSFVTGDWPEIIVGAVSGGTIYLAVLHVLAPKLLPGFVRTLLSGRKAVPV